MSVQDLQAYHRELEASCPMGDVDKWRTLKGIFYAILISIYGYVMNLSGGDSTVIFLSSVGVIVIIFGAEVKEIEVASIFSMVFKNDED